jgi:hypothetical protein
MSNQYEVLSPWAEVDPVPLKGLPPRLDSFSGKTIGLYCNFKVAAKQIFTVLERRLKERFPDSKYVWYYNEMMGVADIESERKEKLEDWIRSVDAVVLAAGD